MRTSTTPEVEASIQAVGRLLRSRGERLTEPRRAVLGALAGRRDHLSADELYDRVVVTHPNVHKSSVYRTLEALTDLGVVQHVHVGHGPTAYHLVEDATPHLHAQCRGCGTILDLSADLLDQAARALADQHGFRLDASHVALSGLCRACAATGTTAIKTQ